MLFGSNIYNSGLFGGGASSVEVFSTDTLVFDGFSLSDSDAMTLTGLRFLGPSREIIGGVIPRGDGLYQTGDYFRELVIEATGIARADTAAGLDALLDTIRKNLRGSRRNLDTIDANGKVKRFVATVDSFEDLFANREHFHITFCPWIVRFKCRIPFGKSRDYTTVTNTITASPTNESITNTGTTKAQPVFILIFNTATSITATAVENTTTGEQIQYTGALAVGDLLEFDSENKTVKKNGTEVDYSGAFPSLETDTNVIRYTVTGTSFDVLVTSKFKPSYLA